MSATTRATAQIDRDRVAALTERQRALYRTRTARSCEYFARASAVMPGGVPSQFQLNDPWPVYLERGVGSLDGQLEKLDGEQQKHIEDELVVEEPLEVRVNGDSLSVTMRTPGDDFDLATGMLWTEGVIHSSDEIGTIAYCPDEQDPDLKNVINVSLVDTSRKWESSRRLWANSSCGLCGKATLDAIRKTCKPITSTATAARELLYSLPLRLWEAQSNFERTGGINAASLPRRRRRAGKARRETKVPAANAARLSITAPPSQSRSAGSR